MRFYERQIPLFYNKLRLFIGLRQQLKRRLFKIIFDNTKIVKKNKRDFFKRIYKNAVHSRIKDAVQYDEIYRFARRLPLRTQLYNLRKHELTKAQTLLSKSVSRQVVNLLDQELIGIDLPNLSAKEIIATVIEQECSGISEDEICRIINRTRIHVRESDHILDAILRWYKDKVLLEHAVIDGLSDNDLILQRLMM